MRKIQRFPFTPGFTRLEVMSTYGQFAPWTIRPRQLAPDLQTTRPQYENTYVTLEKYILMHIK